MVQTPGKSKRAPRIDVRKDATVINADGAEVHVKILDISADGFRIHVLDNLRIGEFVKIRVDHDEVPAQIRWVLGDEAGGAFLDDTDIRSS